jgi:L-gulono-1,4-lactone dehydrogenase
VGDSGLTWCNHSRDQCCRPRRIERPATTDDVRDVVRRAEREGLRVRAVGAGHAWSDCALTDGVIVETDAMSGLLEVDPPHVRVRGGTRIRDLNRLLEREGLALRNMGGYDAQSIAGVVATSTHGSGITFGAFPDVVQSLDLVVAGGELVHLERGDPDFPAAVCGIGCMGIVDSLAIEVRDAFHLRERRRVATWLEARADLAGGVLDRHDHYELFLDPYGDGRLLVTTRDEVARPASESPGDGMRHPLIELASSLPAVGDALRFAARHFPQLLRTRFGHTLRDMQDENYTQVSYRVFNIGEANKLPAYSMELGVPVRDDIHLRTVDRILEIAASGAERGLFHTSPIALRFVGGSDACASMMHGTPTMMIELILVLGTRGGKELLHEYERGLAEFGARPHWGQYNTLGADSGLERMYPEWSAWLEVQRRLNESGVFDSPFTDRIGISRFPNTPRRTG